MSKLYPRRRDVRARLKELHEALRAEAIYEHAGVLMSEADFEANGFDTVEIVDYDRDFITAVRDLMRAGANLEDAVMVVPRGDEDEATEVAEVVHGDDEIAAHG